MKNTERQPKQPATKASAASDSLHKKVIAAEKNVQEARADFEKKSAEYDEALKQQPEKITLLGLAASVKIAKFIYKIKRVEYKLAKATWKASVKADKKSAEKPGAGQSPKSAKNKHTAASPEAAGAAMPSAAKKSSKKKAVATAAA